MSLLAPLYLIAGLAIGLPILAHLIRRRPKAEMTFSSLMFLRESPPQLTKRSRLDDWPLLAMRALALLLLAIAFSRPFWRSIESQSSTSVARRLVVLIDTSASMRRTGIRAAVDRQLDDFLNRLEPTDAVSVIGFDATPRVLLDFDATTTSDLAGLRTTIGQAIEQAEPSWHATDLGTALAFASDHAVDALAKEDADASAVPIHLVVFSDLQQGSDTSALHTFEWPEGVTVQFQTVAADQPGNAFASVMAGDSPEGSDAGDEHWKIRVVNADDSERSQFTLHWADQDGTVREESAVSIQVPPGRSQVLKMTPPLPGDSALMIDGDAHDFDNQHYFAAPRPLQQQLIFLGSPPEATRDDLAHYLAKVPLDNQRRTVAFHTLRTGDPNLAGQLRDLIGDPPDAVRTQLVVLAAVPSSKLTPLLESYVDQGGHLLVVLTEDGNDEAWESTLSVLTGVSELQIDQAEVDDYAMWTQIDFRDPWFAAMSDPQFSDFSKLRFWTHHRLTRADGEPLHQTDGPFVVPARYDSGLPALLRRSLGSGTVSIVTSGWTPRESQLALSTKFIPLVFAWFDTGDRFAAKQTRSMTLQPWTTKHMRALVGESSGEAESVPLLRLPSGDQVPLKSPQDLRAIDRPGLVEVEYQGRAKAVAINLSADESNTTPFDPAEIESLGVALGAPESSSQRAAKERQLRDTELENRQNLWLWLLGVTLGVLALETFWGGRRRSPGKTEHGSAPAEKLG